MYLEAVVVCVNYSDFLAVTLPKNIELVDRLVVVTSPDDRATIRLCDKYSVDCIKTDVMYDSGDKFNKGRAINLGLSNLRHNGWIMHLDADILLPHRFRNALHMAKLDKRYLYGCDRLNSKSYENWERHKGQTVPQHQWRFMVTPQEAFPVGSRLLHLEYGYCPIGYFQLWNSAVRRQYPIVCGSAEHSDVLFAVQWPREQRILLPEFFCYHLESESPPMGANWDGRKTKPFGPDGMTMDYTKNNGQGKSGVINPFDTPKY